MGNIVIIFLLSKVFYIYYLSYYSISELTNLQILNMSENLLFYNLPDDMFTSLQSLRELDISDCGLTTLPKKYLLYIYSILDYLW